MTNDHSRKVEELFQSAMDQPPWERARFLGEACAGDVALRGEVQEMLEHHAAAEHSFLRRPLFEPGPAAMNERAFPQQIGRFRVLGKIGEGGMGMVFEAEQEHPRRKVALKVIRTAIVSDSLLRRFEHEVQILGQLKHPGIAQIYEAGTHDDGTGPVPYFAMEFIDGEPLMDFAERNGLNVRQRLELMAAICDAVHHAHQKGVIHRDLKPANVLIEAPNGVPQPKILDFGVARAIHSDVQLLTMHTEVGQLVGTLSYMSPEQVAGRTEALDIRSDVYTLGVILYEMLARRLPYDLRDHSLPDAGSVIREQEPSRLGSIDTALRGDIETIVAKALAKEKDRRYQSASEFGQDIRRFLSDEPIVARRASRAYQWRKFAKRNKALVGGVAAVFVVLVLGIIGTGLALLRATRAERLAVQRSEESLSSATKAAAVSSFLQGMLASVDPATALGREVTIREALDEAAAKIESGSLKGQADLEADLRFTIGTTYFSLGHYSEAEQHLGTALGLRRGLGGEHGANIAASLESLASVLNAQGRHGEEESLLREALTIERRLHGDRHADVASTMQSLGAALRVQHKYEEAEPFYRSALTMRRELLGAEHVDVAQTVNSLALLLQNKGDYAAAEPLFREALAMRRKLLGDPHPVVAGGINNLAGLLQLRGNLAEAGSLLREALQMRRKLLDPEHPDVAQSLHNLAMFLNDNGEFAEAERLFREALTVWRKTLPEGHTHIANAAAGLGAVLIATHAYAEAEALLRESLAIREASLPEGHWYRFTAMSALGTALAGQGKYTEAEDLLVRGYTGLKDQNHVPLKRKRQALERIVALYESWDRPEAAAPWREELAQLISQ